MNPGHLCPTPRVLFRYTFDVQPTIVPPPKLADLRFQGIVLVHTVVKQIPGWLSKNPEVLVKL